MARNINLSTPECGVSDGMELSFRAPCSCSDVTGVTLDGVTYTLVDASGNSLTSCSDYFAKDAILTVIIDTTKKTATLLNPRVNTYTKSLGTSQDTPSANGTTVWARVKQIENTLPNKSDNGHKHTKSDITDFAHNHDERYFTEDEINAKLNSKSNTGHTHTKSEITDFAHNHDERYYTETEIDAKLNDKAPLAHLHDGRYYSKSEINTKLSEIDTRLNALGFKEGTLTIKDGIGSSFAGIYKQGNIVWWDMSVSSFGGTAYKLTYTGETLIGTIPTDFVPNRTKYNNRYFLGRAFSSTNKQYFIDIKIDQNGNVYFSLAENLSGENFIVACRIEIGYTV